MVGENVLISEQPSSRSGEPDLIRVAFPYPSPVEEVAPAKVDYSPKEIISPKKTLNIRRSGPKTRLVRLEAALMDEPTEISLPQAPPLPPVDETPIPTSPASKAPELGATINKLLKSVGDISLATQENQRQTLLIAAGLNHQAGIVPKIDALQKHLEQSHKVETANQRLFDAMHHELKGYKDNFLFDSLQKPVIRDLLALFDDLGGQARRIAHFLTEQTDCAGANANWKAELQASHDNINNTIFFIIEVLNRLEVTLMESSDEALDLKIHKIVGFEPTTNAKEKNQIVRVVRPGFFWKERVLRPSEVIAKKYSEAPETREIDVS